MDSIADHLGDIDAEDGLDSYLTDAGRIKCGCLMEFPDITAWREHLAGLILERLDMVASPADPSPEAER